MLKKIVLLGEEQPATSMILKHVPGDRDIIMLSIKEKNQPRVSCMVGLNSDGNHTETTQLHFLLETPESSNHI